MLVLGFQGSPRRKGNTSFLLSTFMQAVESLGAQTRIIEVTKKNIIPCKEYVVCEKKGFCPIDDDIKTEIYPLIRQAEVVVLKIWEEMTFAQIANILEISSSTAASRYRYAIGKLTNIALALKKAPSIAQKVRIVWLGTNYPEPGEYNFDNDIPALDPLLESEVAFEMVMVRYGKPSGTDAVKASLGGPRI